MDWLESASRAEAKVKSWNGDVVLVFHNDADGLASGALAKLAMGKLGKKATMYCLEKMYPEVISKIHEHHKGSLFLYLDIGSGEVEMLEETGDEVIIIDHHKTKTPNSDSVMNLDPELFGMSGDKDACGATMAYLLFRDIIGKEYSDLAIVGMQEIPGEPQGLNRLAVEDYGKDPKGKLERIGKVPRSVSRDLTVLGSVGYYTGGVKLGLDLAIHGYSKEIKQVIKELDEKRKSIVRELVASLKLKETKYIQWVDVGDAFRGMGTKTVGTFCSYLVHRGIAPNKILLGFMNVENKIPRIDGIELELEGNYVKVSARVPDMAKEKIESGEWPGLGALMSEACKALNGFGDGHDFAASGIIPRDAKEKLAQEMEAKLGSTHGLGDWV